MSTTPRYVSKVLLLGDSFVGKSCLIQRYVKKEFTQEFRATIGCDFLMKQVETPSGENVTLQVWDTAGQERFQSLGHAFYRGSDGLVLVFDITSLDSFAHLDMWLVSFRDNSGVDDTEFPTILIGNKADLAKERRVTVSEVTQWLSEHPSIKYYECSAKEGTGVDAAFLDLCLTIRSVDNHKAPVLENSTIKVQRSQSPSKKRLNTCCKR